MRRLSLFFTFVLFACCPAEAQSLEGLLRLFGLDSSKRTEQNTEQSLEMQPVAALTAEGLTGAWHYSEPASRYDGDDVFGSIGVKAVENLLPSMYAKAGLSEGKGTMIFTAPDTVSGELGGYVITGRYKFTPENGTLAVSGVIGGIEGTLHGEARLEGGVLTLMFDAQEAASLVERVSPKAAANDNFKLMKSLLDNYPGVKLGCRMKR